MLSRLDFDFLPRLLLFCYLLLHSQKLGSLFGRLECFSQQSLIPNSQHIGEEIASSFSWLLPATTHQHAQDARIGQALLRAALHQFVQVHGKRRGRCGGSCTRCFILSSTNDRTPCLISGRSNILPAAAIVVRAHLILAHVRAALRGCATSTLVLFLVAQHAVL